MRQVAIVRHGPPRRGLEIQECPDPVPGPGQVVIRTEAAGVNFAETLARRGLYPGAPKIPFVPGFEVGGAVVRVGAGVTGFEPGDPVMALLLRGGYADVVVANATNVFRRPDGMNAEVAAALPVQALTAWYALFESGTVRPGDRVLIHAAAGGVGSLAVQLALHAGAQVFGTAGSPEKTALLARNGVHHPIDYSATDYEEEIRRITGGEGLDVVLDSLGGSHIGKAYRLLRPGGRIASYGYAGQSGSRFRMYLGFATMKTLRTAYLLRDSLGFYGVNLVKLSAHPDRLRIRVEDVFRSWADGVLKPSIGARFRLDQAWEAHEALESRRTTGKVLLIP